MATAEPALTLAWGCAEAVANIVNEVHQKTRPVAVLGAGVIGLSAAKVLLERGFKVKLYAQEFSPQSHFGFGGSSMVTFRGLLGGDARRTVDF